MFWFLNLFMAGFAAGSTFHFVMRNRLDPPAHEPPPEVIKLQRSCVLLGFGIVALNLVIGLVMQ